MALKQNIGTGGLYPTGIAPQALDFTQTQQAISQALISQKKEEIKQKKDLMSESEKALLNALSFESVQGLSEKVQLDHLKRYEDFTSRWTEEYRKGDGILSNPQQFQMLKEKRQLDKTTADLKYGVARTAEAQKEFTLHPELYDPETAVRLKNVIDNGLQGLPESYNILIPRQIPWTTYFDAQYKPEMESISKQFNTSIAKDNSISGRLKAIKENEQKASELYDLAVKRTPNIMKGVSREEFIKTKGINYSTESYNAALDKTNRGGGSTKDKNARDYTPTPFEYKTDKYNIVQIPSDVAQADRNFFINKAKNKDTGEVIQLDQSKASLLGVDVDKGVILLQGVGAQAEKGGKPLYSKDGVAVKSSTTKEWSGYTENELKSEDVQKRLLESSLPAGTKADDIKDIDVAKNSDGSITISGELDLGYMGTKGALRGGWFGKNDTQPVEVTLKTFNDPSAQAVFEAPLGDNKPAVAVMFPKVKVRGVPLEDYVDRAGTTSEKQNITEAEYAKLKPGDKYWFNGVEHIKQ